MKNSISLMVDICRDKIKRMLGILYLFAHTTQCRPLRGYNTIVPTDNTNHKDINRTGSENQGEPLVNDIGNLANSIMHKQYNSIMNNGYTERNPYYVEEGEEEADAGDDKSIKYIWVHEEDGMKDDNGNPNPKLHNTGMPTYKGILRPAAKPQKSTTDSHQNAKKMGSGFGGAEGNIKKGQKKPKIRFQTQGAQSKNTWWNNILRTNNQATVPESPRKSIPKRNAVNIPSAWGNNTRTRDGHVPYGANTNYSPKSTAKQGDQTLRANESKYNQTIYAPKKHSQVGMTSKAPVESKVSIKNTQPIPNEQVKIGINSQKERKQNAIVKDPNAGNKGPSVKLHRTKIHRRLVDFPIAKDDNTTPGPDSTKNETPFPPTGNVRNLISRYNQQTDEMKADRSPPIEKRNRRGNTNPTN